MTTKKLKFINDGIVDGKVEFKAGEVYDIPVESGSYDRWVKRGAVEVEESEEKEAPKKKAAKETSL